MLTPWRANERGKTEVWSNEHLTYPGTDATGHSIVEVVITQERGRYVVYSVRDDGALCWGSFHDTADEAIWEMDRRCTMYRDQKLRQLASCGDA